MTIFPSDISFMNPSFIFNNVSNTIETSAYYKNKDSYWFLLPIHRTVALISQRVIILKTHLALVFDFLLVYNMELNCDDNLWNDNLVWMQQTILMHFFPTPAVMVICHEVVTASKQLQSKWSCSICLNHPFEEIHKEGRRFSKSTEEYSRFQICNFVKDPTFSSRPALSHRNGANRLLRF